MIDYRSLLIHIEPTKTSHDRLALSVRMAQTLNAVLIGVGGAMPQYLTNPWLASIDGCAVQMVRDDEEASLKECKSRFFKAASELGARAKWRAIEDYPDRSLVESCAGADLIIANLRTANAAISPSGADVVMRAGLPVLAVPEGIEDLNARSIVIAWKNTAQTRRAVSDALPFLLRAETVTVVDVQDAGDTASSSSADDVVERLKRHGVDLRVQVLERGSGDVGAILLDFVETGLIDLVVAGAYGHTKAQEWVFGGVTQTLMERCSRPVLFSH